MNEQIGVIIDKGPQPWAIIQQTNGYANLELEGSCRVPDDAGASLQVYARIVREDCAEPVVDWTAADMNGNNTWRLTLEAVPAGGLYRLETSLAQGNSGAHEWNMRGDMIHHIGVGDLWVIAGQSNSAGYGKGPVNDPPEFGIHLFRNSGRWDLASHPFNESTDSLHFQNRESSNPGHSPYLAFARTVKRETGWPIGLVQTALGGSPLSSWNPEEDGTLYRLMLDIIRSVGGKVRGMLWYQGCSDASPELAPSYLDRFRTMVEACRRDLGQPEFPVLTVQLNRYTVPAATEADNTSWGMIRDHQRRAAFLIPHVAVIPALDCPLSDEIHNSPAGNLLIGERMAKAALATVYGKPLHYRAPEIASAQTVDDDRRTIELVFDQVKGYLLPTGSWDGIFTVEDSEGSVAVQEAAPTSRNVIRLKLARPLASGGQVHGAYERNPASYLLLDSVTYMPILSFYRVPVQS